MKEKLKTVWNKIKIFFLLIPFAFVKSSNKITSADTSTDKSDVIQINNSGDILQTLARGEFNVEYVQQFYQTLEKSDKYYYQTDETVKNNDASKYGISINDEDANKDDYTDSFKLKNHFQKINEYKESSLKEIINKQFKERNLIPEDLLEVEYIVDNQIDDDYLNNAITLLKAEDNVINITDDDLNKTYSFYSATEEIVKHKLYEYAKCVIVKNDNHYRRLDFYFTNLMLRPTLDEYEDFIKITDFNYTTKYGETYKYKIDKFIGLTIKGNFNILSFQSNQPIIIPCTVDLSKLNNY